jgi:hypothetical protein
MDFDSIESGTSVLLTGDDSDALESVYYRLVAASDGERSVLLSTEARAATIKRELDSAVPGARDRASILTAVGADAGEDVTTVDDLSDLTRLGMDLSTAIADSQQTSERFRAGIHLCSTIGTRVEDTRSLYRFLNTNFLTALRRNDAIGVCALDTGADIEGDLRSIVKGMETSFKARIHVESDGPRTVTVSTTGLDGPSETTLSL